MINTKQDHEYEQRMYFLTPYNISPVQIGIQSLHSVVEYGLEHGDSTTYQKWARVDKTVIILNGGTTNITSGTLDAHLTTLRQNKVPVGVFYEPDLNDALTAVAFLVDERVFSKELTPTEAKWKYRSDSGVIGMNPETFQEEGKQRLAELGTEQNIFLRQFIKQFRLA